MNLKQFNYENVVSYKDTLISNKEKMIEAFNKYQSESSRIDTNWMGSSANVSKEEMERLTSQYNGFLAKVEDFITVLSNSEQEFISTEQENAARYNS